MGTVVYCHDLPFFFNEENELFSSGFSDQYFARFFDSGFSRVEIISRSLFLSDESDSGLELLSSDCVSLFKSIKNSYINLISPAVVYKVFRLIRRADLVVLSTPSVVGLYISLVCILMRKEYVCEVAGEHTAFSTKKFGRIIDSFLSFYMPYMVRRASGATYVTNDLASRYSNNNRFVGSNVNLSRLYPRSDYALKSAGGVVNIGFVGGLVERKGIRTIIHAAKSIKDECGGSIVFHIIGGHADQDWSSLCEQFGVREMFKFHGLLKRGDINVILRSMDIYIQPSISEGVPRATIEAMAHGLPVIATNLPGFKEILDSALLVNPEDYNSLAEKIRVLVMSSEIRMQQGVVNYKRASDFLYADMHEARVDFYRKVFNSITSGVN